MITALVGWAIIAVVVAVAYSLHRKHRVAALREAPAHDDGGSPYRRAGPEPEVHAVGCKGCEWMDRYGRWQPPEVMFEAGIPIECMMLKRRMTRAQIDELADVCGYALVGSTGRVHEWDSGYP